MRKHWNERESKPLWLYSTHIKTGFSASNAELSGGRQQRSGDVSGTCRAQLGCFSERGEARHFDIDVSDVDVARNLGQVHVLHSGDGASGSR